MARNVHIKICCIQNAAELALAQRYKAYAVGLVGPMPSGPGQIGLFNISQLNRLIEEQSEGRMPRPFQLTATTTAESILADQEATGVGTLQLVDAVPIAELEHVRAAVPELKLVQVIHVQGPQSLDQALAVAPYIDMLLLDSGAPNKPVKELGGTGRVHNWAISAEIVEEVDVPVWLAGGLTPENVGQAIAEVQPYGVDVCSGLRTARGALDEAKLKAFAEAVRP